jgi:methionyl-tRNA formyltransferase
VRLVFAGTPEVAVPSLRALLASSHEVVAVITRPPARAGRGRQVVDSPVAQVARAAGLEVLTPTRPSEPDFQARLVELAPQCCPVVAYGALVPQSALDIPEHGWVNLHFSLLPAWRGAAPVQHAIMAGDTVTGASTFRLEAGLDTGPVYGLMTESIYADDTSGTLLSRLADAGAGLLVATVDGIADGSLEARPQAEDGVSLAPKVEVADARIDWAQPATRIDRLVRGCTPAPGAWTTLDGARLKVGPIAFGPRPESPDDALAPGQLAVSKHEVRVGTSTVPVVLGEVQPPGKRPMPAADWARGARIASGTRLGDDA